MSKVNSSAGSLGKLYVQLAGSVHESCVSLCNTTCPVHCRQSIAKRAGKTFVMVNWSHWGCFEVPSLECLQELLLHLTFRL